jgi:hypothetical protein
MALAIQLQGEGSSRIAAFRQRNVSTTDAFGGDLRTQHYPCTATCGAAEGGCKLRVLQRSIQDEPAARRRPRHPDDLTILRAPVYVAQSAEVGDR